MKKKFSRILGVGLTLVMVLTLAVAFSPISAVASPDENEWSKFSYPKDGSAGDWFRSDNITDGSLGPIARAINGDLYVYAKDDGVDHLFLSDDDGRTWSKTDYADDLTGEVAITDIACSSIDGEIVYVTDGSHVYWADDAGATFKAIAAASLATAVSGETITSLDVGYNASDEPFVFIATKAATGKDNGGVYYVAQVGYPSEWTDLGITYADAGAYMDVFAIAASPDFASSKEVMAISSNSTLEFTAALSNSYGTIGDWDELDLIQSGDSVNITATDSSRIRFPEDFDTDDTYEMFVGIVADTGGDVFRVTDDDAYDLDVDTANISVSSLALVGDYGATTMVAGQDTSAVVWYSTDDGESWDETDKNPSGTTINAVAMADSETVWVTASGEEGAVSLSIDGGALFNQISMINTNIDIIDSSAFSRGYASDETMFMVTTFDTDPDTFSLFRYDGDYWERVFVSTLAEPALGTIDLVQLSPDFLSDDTLFVAYKATPIIYYSTDGGNDWTKMSREPKKALTSWIVIDEDVVIAGTANQQVWKTTQHGRRAWDDYDVDGAGKITTFALSPNFATDETILLGDDDGGIFISEDIGESWDQVGDDIITGTKTTYVYFDPDYATNDTIYAASGGEADRCVIDTSEKWADQTWKEFTVGKTDLDLDTATGLYVSTDGTLYIADSTAVVDGDETADKGGVWRSLDPLDDITVKDEIVFEVVSADFELTVGAQLESLQLTSGSNILWSRDGTNLWTYEDLLATEVIPTSPADGATIDDPDIVTFKWKELTGAVEYTLKYTDDEDWLENITTLDKIEDPVKTVEDGVTIAADGTTKCSIDAHTTYYWKVMVSGGEPLLSRYSDDTRSFTTELSPVERTFEWLPENGAQDIIVNPAFGWTRVSGATAYEFELATAPDFSGATTATPEINSCVSPSTLSYSTTYYWRVRGLKDTTVISDWRSGAFATMAKPVEPVPPVEVTPAPPAPVLPTPTTPAYIWAIIAIGAILAITVIVLIVRTRRVV